MIGPNNIVIAAAGSGKTTFLVREAIKVKDDDVLITTYTESNEAEIKQTLFEANGHIPSNIVVMTWFTFLITHGVKPFQGCLFNFPCKGDVAHLKSLGPTRTQPAGPANLLGRRRVQ